MAQPHRKPKAPISRSFLFLLFSLLLLPGILFPKTPGEAVTLPEEHLTYHVVVVGAGSGGTHVPVSYTHLTLPTILLVQISVVAVSLKKKNSRPPHNVQAEATEIRQHTRRSQNKNSPYYNS
eukprot:TRINITY_DN32693_c0_g1_i2.p4 TRINITY_DN32693_c0_g1~~TRINITY_DN32693_c0_g1_i2.p4  ORF type:complete len:122 (-),score=20.46 TRINITY_DN32693_c0_g1_i2:6-371(-)